MARQAMRQLPIEEPMVCSGLLRPRKNSPNTKRSSADRISHFGPPEAPARMETRSAEKPSARICARACGPARMVRCLGLVMRVGRALSAGNYKAFAQADLLPKPQSPLTPKHSATRGGDMQRSVVLAGVLAAVLGGGVWTAAASSLPVAEERASQPAQSELS